ncbi:glycosyltransferase family 4 protein [Candidatus Enterococcus mangumiae]|uniref:Glycosyl transferase family 1 domain-containing protein n=1 Tax=Candidatus Enterococcus mangumiae TaxID=2230878 RepID=A0ABZ2SUC4_9ENTE|nr:glycosyltransferase family 4 protein [Enterococcus sp. DIV1094]MBO0488941.1 glycosyltransferase family 4 protein [Enterococcus sp. DIV1094]
MNIMIVGPDPDAQGGIATVIQNFKTAKVPEDSQFFFHQTWSEKGRFWTQCKAFMTFRAHIKKEKCHILHFHVAQKGSFYRKSLLLLLTPRHCRTIFHMHASQFDQFYENGHPLIKCWIRFILKRVNQLVVLSNSWAAYYQTLTHTAIAILPNAVELPSQNLYEPKASCILTLGRIGKRKGSFDLLEVAKACEAEFPAIHFMLYGDEENEEVAQQIKSENIHNVSLNGWVAKEELPSLFQQTVLHFLPSYHEGLPMAILETMAAGIPNITTKVGGIPELIEQDRNGYLVDAGDTQAMLEGLRKLLQDEDHRLQLSRSARSTIAEDYALQPYLAKWHEIYKKQFSLLQKNNTRGAL